MTREEEPVKAGGGWKGIGSCATRAFAFKKKLNVIFLCICVGVHTLPCVCGGQRTTCGNWFSPSIVGLPGTELRSLGLTITHKAFSPFSPRLHFASDDALFPFSNHFYLSISFLSVTKANIGIRQNLCSSASVLAGRS